MLQAVHPNSRITRICLTFNIWLSATSESSSNTTVGASLYMCRHTFYQKWKHQTQSFELTNHEFKLENFKHENIQSCAWLTWFDNVASYVHGAALVVEIPWCTVCMGRYVYHPAPAGVLPCAYSTGSVMIRSRNLSQKYFLAVPNMIKRKALMLNKLIQRQRSAYNNGESLQPQVQPTCSLASLMNDFVEKKLQATSSWPFPIDIIVKFSRKLLPVNCIHQKANQYQGILSISRPD